MTKLEFIFELRERLSFLPEEEIDEHTDFYIEMIDDRMEEGLSEEDAVADIGTVDEIASQIIAEIPLSRLVKSKIKAKNRLGGWNIVLLILGFPLWFPLLAAAFAVGIALYASLWSVIISLWAVWFSVLACAIAGVLVGIVLIVKSAVLPGIALIGAGIFLRGLSIFLFALSKESVRGAAVLTKGVIRGIKNSFVKKEAAHD